MPSKFEKLHIPKDKDKRVKLTDDDRNEIYYRYNVIGGVSQRELAREYGVSRRLITFIIDPEKKAQNYANRIANGGSKQYYDKDQHTAAMRRHRAYKKELYEEGLLIDESGKDSTERDH